MVTFFRHIDWLGSIRYINKWTSPDSKRWYLAAQMARMLRYVFMYIPIVEKSRYHEEFNYHCTYHQWRDSPGDLLYQVFLLWCILSQTDACNSLIMTFYPFHFTPSLSSSHFTRPFTISTTQLTILSACPWNPITYFSRGRTTAWRKIY